MTGLIVGVGVLVTGSLGAVIGILALLLLSIEPGARRPSAACSSAAGSAGSRCSAPRPARCGEGCVFPDLPPWIVASLAMIGLGLVLTGLAFRRRRRDPTAAPA